jgi:hypothetical protein
MKNITTKINKKYYDKKIKDVTTKINEEYYNKNN